VARRLVAIAATLAVVASAPVALGGTSQRAADAKLARALARLVSMPGGPPGAIAVVQRGDTVKVFSAGVAELGAKRRPSANDHVRLASMSKAYSGAAALSASIFVDSSALRANPRSRIITWPSLTESGLSISMSKTQKAQGRRPNSASKVAR
jgi:hypothetical protein